MKRVHDDETRRVAVPRLRPFIVDHTEELERLVKLAPVRAELETMRRARDEEETRPIRRA